MFLVFFILWIVLNGRVTAEILAVGAVLSALISFFTIRVIGYSPRQDLNAIRNLPLYAAYVVVLVVSIVISSIRVMSIALSPRKHPDPVIVEFRSGIGTETGNVLLANSITLTPGTYTVHLLGDRFAIHCLRPEFAEGIEDSIFVRLLRRMK